MPLHPQCETLLHGIAQAGAPPLQEMTPAEARQVMHNLAMADPREEVARVDDRHVPAPEGHEIPVRVYTPADAIGTEAGLLIWFHGGGWVVGDLETTDATCRALANRSGAVVVSVDYRLAPEHPAPAGLDDAVEAVLWCVENAELLGIDATKVAVGGDSAGGNLATMACVRLRDQFGPAIAFQLLVYPVTDLTLSHPSMQENAEGYLLTKAGMEWFASHYLQGRPAADPQLSPLHAEDLTGLPPALIITAEYDPLRDEGEAYAARLREAGVPVEAVRYDGQIHGFVGLAGLLDDGRHALDLAGAALRGALG